MNNKYLIALFLTVMQMGGLSRAQDASQNFNKYWYYRYRLVNNFMKIGDTQGCSIPAAERGGDGYNILAWGDGPNIGWYMGVLATEYRLLADSKQDASQTVKELFYVLEAFNRTDFFAETYFKDGNGNPGTASLNGFYVRDDVPGDFLNGDCTDPSSNGCHFNSGLVPSYCDGAPPGVSHPWSVPTSQPCKVSKVRSIYNDNLSPESQDNAIHILMGLALINKCVDENITYNGKVFSYEGYGENRIVSEARNIIDRIVDWIRDHNWRIKNPVTDTYIINEEGGDARAYAYALAEAACKATNKTDYTFPATGETCFDYHDQRTLIDQPLWQLLKSPYVFSGIALSNSYNDHLVGLLAALGNSWWIVPIINVTNEKLSSFFYPWPFHKREYIPLLRQVLHGGNNGVPNSVYKNLLNAAPCEGPHNTDGDLTSDWSIENMFKDPKYRGVLNPDELTKGEYSGLDYMLLFNLYALAKNGTNNPYLSSDFNLIERRIAIDFPMPFPGPDPGSHDSPVEVDAFHSIVAVSKIKSDGDMTYRAGQEIAFLPGFGVDQGADFAAFVDPFSCSTTGSSGSYVRPASGDTVPLTYFNEPTSYENVNHAGNDVDPSVLPYDQESIDSVASNGLTIIPNPSHGVFTLEITEGTANDVFIYDNLGQLVYDGKINGKQAIDLSMHGRGIYFIKVQNETNVLTGKVVVDQ